MELKTLKYINNTKQLPGYNTGWEKFKSRWNNGGGEKAMNAAVNGLDAAFQFNSMKTPANYAGDFVGKYGINTDASIDGINYQQYNDINTEAEESRMAQQRDSKIMQGATLGATTGLGLGTAAGALFSSSAAAATAATAGGAAGAATGAGLGSWLGPIGAIAGLGLGALLGGIFGNKSKHEEEEQMRIAQIKQNNANEFWRTGALSAALRNKALERYGDTNRFNLFSSALGSENIVHTSDGIKSGKRNAKLDDGELIIKKNGQPGSYVNGNPNQIDGEYGYLKNGESVASNILKVPGTDMTFAQYYPLAYAAGKGPETLALQAAVRENNNDMKKGKLTHAWGGLENILATIPGMIQSWRDYKDISNDDIHRTQLNPFNPYERKAADIMAGRVMSAYPQMRAITNEQAAQTYRINQSGGLSAMQKTMANLTNNMNSKIARANALANVQQINNQFAKENAELLNNMGNTARDATLRAQMFNEQQTAAAHAAKTQGLNMAKRNMLDYATQFAKNAWEKNQFDRMMELYWENVRNDRLKAQQKPSTKKSTIDPISMTKNFINTPKITVPFATQDVSVNTGYQPLPQFNWPIKWK